jgi:hypothetical protein
MRNRCSQIGSVVLVIVLIVCLPAVLRTPGARRAHGAVVSSVSPTNPTPGSTVTLTGSGFTGATQLTFWKSGTDSSTAVNVINDSTLQAVVPVLSGGNGPMSFLLFTPGPSITMATDANVTQITGNASGTGSEEYWVRSGGNFSPGGSNLDYIDSGGSITTGGVGSNIILVESGATANVQGGGAGHRVYFEPGANANLNPSYAFINPVADVSLSILPQAVEYTVPEPAGAALLLAGVLPMLRRRDAKTGEV